MNTAEVREATHVLENLGWTELFAILCPGVITLLSIALWTRPKLADIFGTAMAHNEFVVAIVFLLVSYAVGLVVAVLSGEAADHYLNLLGQRNSHYEVNMFAWPVWWFFFWMPRRPTNRELVRAKLRIQLDLERFGLHGLSGNLQQWTNLATYRTMVADCLARPAAFVLREAESAHRRRLFGLGVGSAAMLVSLQAIARIALRLLGHVFWRCAVPAWVAALPNTSTSALLSIAIAGMGGSFCLRFAAGRFFDYETLLTCSRPLSLEQPASLAPAPENPRGKWRPVMDSLRDALFGPASGE